MESVSVIVPVYNVEEHIEKCLDSIVGQTYKELEIILVDDGSPDRCGAICEEYAKRDARIHVIHKKNAGLGMARNSGLEIAKGKYVVFIDSDDWIEPDMVERLLAPAQKEKCDLVVSGIIREFVGRKRVSFPVGNRVRQIERENILNEVLLPVLGTEPSAPRDIGLEMSVCTNLYKREIIEKNKIRFVSERKYLSEDLFFNIHYIMQCQRAILLPDCFYHYRMNNISLTNAFRPNRFSLLCMLYETECKILDEYGILTDAQNRVNRTMIMKTRNTIRILVNSKNAPLEQRRKSLKQILSSPVLQTVLARNPIGDYRISLRIPAILMKHKNINLLWMEERMRYLLKRVL